MPIEPLTDRTRWLNRLECGEEEVANPSPRQIEFLIAKLRVFTRGSWIRHGAPPTRLAIHPAGAPLAAVPHRLVAGTQAHWHGETGDRVEVLSVAFSHIHDLRRLDGR